MFSRPLPREEVPLTYRALLGELARPASGAGAEEALQGLRSALRRDLGVKHVCLLSSARAGLYLLLDQIARRHPGGEVLLNHYNFFAVPQMAQVAGQRPFFVDPSDPQGEAPAADLDAAIGPRTCALLVSHHFGRPSFMPPIVELARERGLEIVEDCAHAYGARVVGRSVGSFGRGGAFSLSLTKGLTGVSGGVVVSDDDETGEALARLEPRLPRGAAAHVWSSLATAVAGKAVLGRHAYPLLTHLPNLVLLHAGVDLLEGLMAEPRSPTPTSVEPERMHPSYARLSLAHLSTVRVEQAARRDHARVLLGSDGPGTAFQRLAMPAFDTDRSPTWLNFVIRTTDVAALRLRLLRAGFDSRRDYLGPMTDDAGRFPRSTRLPAESLYLPIRSLRSREDARRLRAVLVAFDEGR